MNSQHTIFDLFGGIRPMARALEVPASNVSSWKRVGRIPAENQPHVLERGQELGLPVTAEHVVYPLGRPIRPVASKAVGRTGSARYGNNRAILDTCGAGAPA